MLITYGKVIWLVSSGCKVVPWGIADLAQKLILEKGFRNDGKVIGRGIVVFIKQSMRIHEMGILTAELPRSLVHHIGKGFLASCHMLGNGSGNLIGGGNKDTVQTLFHSHSLSFIDPDIGAALLDTEDSIMGKCHDLVHGAFSGSDQTGKQLGGACRIKLLVDIFGIENHTGIGFQHDGAFCADGGTLRPVFNLIALYGKGQTLLLLGSSLVQVSRGSQSGDGCHGSCYI